MIRTGKVILILACMIPAALFCGCRQQTSQTSPNGPKIGHRMSQVVSADNAAQAVTDSSDRLSESPSGQDRNTTNDVSEITDAIPHPNGDKLKPQGPQPTVAEAVASMTTGETGNDAPDTETGNDAPDTETVNDAPDTETENDAPDTESVNNAPDTETGNGQSQQATTEPNKAPANQSEGRITARQNHQLYSKCEQVLCKYVDKDGNVDYRLLRRKRGDIVDAANTFDLIKLKEQIDWSDNEKIAMWINAYNIFTLKLIIDNYPIKPLWWASLRYPDGIMHIPGAWEKMYFNVMGSQYTLREIEREILLGQFHDPRTCFALSYASMGGAFLRNEPFYPEQLDKQLDEQVQRFVRDPRGVKIDLENDILYLSDIFIWYKQELIDKYGDIKNFREREPDIKAYLNFIVNYLPQEDVEYLTRHEFSVKFISYDWKLNDQPRQ